MKVDLGVAGKRRRLAGAKRASRPGRTVAVVVLLAAVAAVIVVLLGSSPSTPATANGTAAAGAATVERRNLVDTDTEAGTLGYESPHTVYDRLSGTVTWLPHVGQLIKPGATLFAVDGQPVILMGGTSPAYRALAPGITAGEDVRELNRSLVALGFDPDAIVLDDEWQAATTAGVEALQHSRGETETGKLALGRVVFLPGAQLVSSVEGTLGGNGSGTTGAAYFGGARTRFASLETNGPPPGSEAETKRLKAEIKRLKYQLKKAASASPSNPPSPGKSGGGSSPESSTRGEGATSVAILQTTGTRLVVTVDLEASKQHEAKPGQAVTVDLPDGKEVKGTVTAVSSVAQKPVGNGSNEGSGGPGGENSGSTVPVTIRLRRGQFGAGLDQASVSVNFVRAVARNVLSAPVTALVATGGAKFALQEAGQPHRLIPVTPGLSAAGEVQVSGPGVRPGLRVSDSQG